MYGFLTAFFFLNSFVKYQALDSLPIFRLLICQSQCYEEREHDSQLESDENPRKDFEGYKDCQQSLLYPSKSLTRSVS